MAGCCRDQYGGSCSSRRSISDHWAPRVKPAELIDEGTPVTLRFHPDDAPAFDVSAVVWRVDPDGLVFFFVGALEERRDPAAGGVCAHGGVRRTPLARTGRTHARVAAALEEVHVLENRVTRRPRMLQEPPQNS